MNGKGSVKLLGSSPSPFVNRVQISLKLKSIEHEFLLETFGSKSELLLKSNPVHKKIPVLIHDDKPISESLIIIQYIDEQWSSGHSIFPADPYDRAITRFWAAYVDDKLIPSFRDFLMASEKERPAILEKLNEGLGFLDVAFVKFSKGKLFFGGNDISYLDIAFGSFLGCLKAIEKLREVSLLDESKTPHLVVWAESFLSHEAVKGFILDTDTLVEKISHELNMIKSMVDNK
ncbi:glutathione S-transferase U17-like [Impatiens glandulifera]|uniref:glutathione S-transferase U17-like n=1 Tax=Impatiens glandulifera TaxID=253017 RepID=UPI001FB1942C|nr:glutathione S-transferase U17-like [Impatiens glandulifera]